MTEAAALIEKEGCPPGPVWIRAERQTAGVGRRGRAWVHDPRNLAATLIVPVPPDIGAHPALLSFWPGLALLDAIEDLGHSGSRLKWPNDVLDAEGRKLCGILPQFVAPPVGPVALIGIGANLAAAPDGAGIIAGEPAPPPAEFLASLHAHLGAWWQVYAEKGFAEIRAAWLSRAVGLGQPILVRLSGETRQGTFAGLATDGALLLGTKTGTERILAADIFLATPKAE